MMTRAGLVSVVGGLHNMQDPIKRATKCGLGHRPVPTTLHSTPISVSSELLSLGNAVLDQEPGQPHAWIPDCQLRRKNPSNAQISSP